jgi:uncharacterized protein
VNVLIALLSAKHPFHVYAHEWFAENRRHGSATCPITLNGCARILTKEALGLNTTIADVSRRLRNATAAADHTFWTDTLALTSWIFHPQFIRGSGQITDVYLLALATTNGGRLVTFDRSIPLAAVDGASAENLEILTVPAA